MEKQEKRNPFIVGPKGGTGGLNFESLTNKMKTDKHYLKYSDNKFKNLSLNILYTVGTVIFLGLLIYQIIEWIKF